MTVSSVAAFKNSSPFDFLSQHRCHSPSISDHHREAEALPLKTWIRGEGQAPNNGIKDLFMAVAARIGASGHVSSSTNTIFVMMRNLSGVLMCQSPTTGLRMSLWSLTSIKTCNTDSDCRTQRTVTPQNRRNVFSVTPQRWWHGSEQDRHPPPYTRTHRHTHKEGTGAGGKPGNALIWVTYL